MIKDVFISDEIQETIMIGFVGLTLLERGYTAESVAKAVGVPVEFAKRLADEGIKSHSFKQPSLVCKKSIPDPMKIDEEEFRIPFYLKYVKEVPIFVTEESGVTDAHLLQYHIFATGGFEAENMLDDPDFYEEEKPFEPAFDEFIRSQCDVGANKNCDVKEFYLKWIDWSASKNVRSASAQVIGKRLKAILPNIDTQKYRIGGDQFSRRYIGIALKQAS